MLQNDYVVKKDFKNILLDSFYIKSLAPKSKLKIVSKKKNTIYCFKWWRYGLENYQ
jgi:hypothetical protein